MHALAWWPLLLLVFCSLPAEGYVYNTSSPSCSIASIPPGPLLPSTCSPNASATIEEAVARAWEFAPIVHWHPLEPYLLQSPDFWFEKAQLYLSDGKPQGSSAYDFILSNVQDFIMMSPKTYITVINSSVLSQEEKNSILGGASFDANNHSTARVAFTVNEYMENYFVYNFNTFYSWNGCSNQAISLNFEGVRNITNYLMCPTGVHEGDWERVSVMVCKSDWKIKRLAYSQHYWTETRDCTQEGQCPFSDTGHPMAYAGLDGHGNYYTPSPLYVYEYVASNITKSVTIENLGGLYIGDRTIVNPDKSWVPRPDLLLYVPTMQNSSSNATDIEWSDYAGNWGTPLKLPAVTLECLNGEQTERYPCPKDDKSVELIYQMLKLVQGLPIPVELGGTGDSGYTGADVTNQTEIGYGGISGPRTRTYSYTWSTKDPLIQTKFNFTTLTCPEQTVIGKSYPSLDPAVFDVSVDTIVNYLIWVAVGDVLFTFVLILVISLPMVLDKSAKVQHFVVNKAQFMAGKAHRAVGRTASMAQNAMMKFRRSSKDIKGLSAKQIKDLEAGGDGARPPVEVVKLPAAAPEGDITPTAASVVSVEDATDAAAAPGSGLSMLPSAATDDDVFDFDLVLTKESESTRSVVWLVLGVVLLIAGSVLSIYGVVEVVDDSVIAAALVKLNAGSVGTTLKWLFIISLALIAFFDILVAYVLFFMRPSHFKFGKWTVRNYLGGYDWVLSHTFELYVASLGQITMSLCISVLFFALGLLTTIVQVATRILCKNLMSVSVFGQSPLDVCIQVPYIGDGNEICGWEAMELCANVTTMQVKFVMFGAMSLIWGHLVWLIVLATNLERHRQRRIVLRNSESMEELMEEKAAKGQALARN